MITKCHQSVACVWLTKQLNPEGNESSCFLATRHKKKDKDNGNQD